MIDELRSLAEREIGTLWRTRAVAGVDMLMVQTGA